MSDHSNNHPHSKSASVKPANPVKTAIAVAVGAFATIIGIVLLTRFAVGTHELGATAVSANTPEAVGNRIAPAANFVVDPKAAPMQASIPVATPGTGAAPVVAVASPIVAMAIPAAVPAGAAAPAATGENVYKGGCVACHGAGIAGAPKAGDKLAWSPRIAQGKPTLYEHAIKGYQGKAGVMPAKGGNGSLADADVKAAVDYMVAQAK